MKLHEEFLVEQGGKMFALEVCFQCGGRLFLFLKRGYQVELERRCGRASTLGKAQEPAVLG